MACSARQTEKRKKRNEDTKSTEHKVNFITFFSMSQCVGRIECIDPSAKLKPSKQNGPRETKKPIWVMTEILQQYTNFTQFV